MLYQLSYFPNPWKRRILYQKDSDSRKGEFRTAIPVAAEAVHADVLHAVRQTAPVLYSSTFL